MTTIYYSTTKQAGDAETQAESSFYDIRPCLSSVFLNDVFLLSITIFFLRTRRTEFWPMSTANPSSPFFFLPLLHFLPATLLRLPFLRTKISWLDWIFFFLFPAEDEEQRSEIRFSSGSDGCENELLNLTRRKKSEMHLHSYALLSKFTTTFLQPRLSTPPPSLSQAFSRSLS